MTTLDIDDVHRQAGSQEVVELHGTSCQATCMNCFTVLSIEDLVESSSSPGGVPRCPCCANVLKPNVILFGEPLPHAALGRACGWVQARDLVLVIGSSLEVFSAAALSHDVVSDGASLLVIGRDSTYLDSRAALVFRREPAEAVAEIAREVLCDRTPV